MSINLWRKRIHEARTYLAGLFHTTWSQLRRHAVSLGARGASVAKRAAAVIGRFVVRLLREERRLLILDTQSKPTVGVLGGWLCLAFALGVIALAAIFADRPDATISQTAGFITFALVVCAALLMGWEPVLRRRVASPPPQLNETRRSRNWILEAPAILINTIDHVGVRWIAVAAGVNQSRPKWRYVWLAVTLAVLLGSCFILPVQFAAWPLLASLAVCFFIVRRWNWIETDRSTFLVSRQSGSRLIRIGFSDDLRDEALVAIKCMLFIIPFGLWRLEQIVPGTFKGEAAHKADYIRWVGYFGAELAKAVPFVDWSEVFNIANGSPIEPETPLGAQVVFCLRAALDLLLLSAVVQSVQIASSTAEQLQAFQSRDLPILDPFTGREIFSRLGRRLRTAEGVTQDAELASYTHYMPARLAEILDTYSVRTEEDQNVRCAALSIACVAQTPNHRTLLTQSTVGNVPEQEKALSLSLLKSADLSALMSVIYRVNRDRLPSDKLDESVNAKGALDPDASRAIEFARRLGQTDVCKTAPIPAGQYTRGSPDSEVGRRPSESPQRKVSIDAFEMGACPVTFEEYDAFCSATKHDRADDAGWGRDRMPVINVSWYDARSFCSWLSDVTGDEYRLPSESEWEYACRAGTETPYSFGVSLDPKFAHFDRSKTNIYVDHIDSPQRRPVPVGERLPNAMGLYDMHGNVCEWCADYWNDTYEGAPATGSARTSGNTSRRVIRGGSSTDDPEWLRSAARGRGVPWERAVNWGFRVVRIPARSEGRS